MSIILVTASTRACGPIILATDHFDDSQQLEKSEDCVSAQLELNMAGECHDIYWSRTNYCKICQRLDPRLSVPVTVSTVPSKHLASRNKLPGNG